MLERKETVLNRLFKNLVPFSLLVGCVVLMLLLIATSLNIFESATMSFAVISVCLATLTGADVHARRVQLTDNYNLEIWMSIACVVTLVGAWFLLSLKPELTVDLIVYPTIVNIYMVVYLGNITNHYRNRHFQEKHYY